METQTHNTGRSGYGFVIAVLTLIIAALGAMLYMEKTDTTTGQASAAITDAQASVLSIDFIPEKAMLKMDDGTEMFVYEGKTWVAYDGKPLELVVVNDPNCGEDCDTAAPVTLLKNTITPAMVVTEVDINTPKGEEYIETYGLTNVPSYLVSKGVIEKEIFTQAAQAFKVVAGEELILIDGNQFRLPRGKLLKAPEFADLDTEPRFGTDGKITVVEFTAYQCGYCKRFYDGAKETIDRLVAEGKINFVLKDYPIGKPDPHVAANCVASIGGDYWKIHDDIIANQSDVSRAPDAGVSWIRAKAIEYGLDGAEFDTCMTDGVELAEVQADQAEGQQYGVTGTPALFIGTSFVPGAISGEQLEQYVNAQL